VTGPPPRSSRSLSAALAERAAARADGTLRIDEFMATALYDPKGGYYVRAEAIGGFRRDFATIPSLFPVLGQAVARWALSLPPHRWNTLDLIEVGAGGGHLAADILQAVGWWSRRRIRYHIVETSPGLRQAQQAKLAGRRVIWHDSVTAAVTAARRPVVISNELVDAFPCRLLQFAGETWRELRLKWPPATRGSLSPYPVEDLDRGFFSALSPKNWPGGAIPAGQIVEIHPSYRQWLSRWLPAAGNLHHLTIDYGDVMPDLYAGRPGGSFRGYLAHQRVTGPAVWRAAGNIDLTCDVNFTDLKTWGREMGLATRELTDQGGFLRRWLPDRMISASGPDLAAVMDPDGAGGAFKVLWQSR
jgi:SAM-dependent MidA family methyltransferase